MYLCDSAFASPYTGFLWRRAASAVAPWPRMLSISYIWCMDTEIWCRSIMDKAARRVRILLHNMFLWVTTTCILVELVAACTLNRPSLFTYLALQAPQDPIAAFTACLLMSGMHCSSIYACRLLSMFSAALGAVLASPLLLLTGCWEPSAWCMDTAIWLQV
jgi:hypothetical protein